MINLLSEKNVQALQGLGEHHGLLIMDVVISRSMDQVELFVAHVASQTTDVAVVVAHFVVCWSRQAHIPLSVNGIVVDPVGHRSH